jgi:tetratricopeptide (TPR) repeat protein
MTNKKIKICLNSMAGNEEHVILRMLESCYKYIDFWVIQCNGSDRTQSIIENFFKDKNIPGFCYNTIWKSPGWNRNGTLKKCLSSNHGCDWILRMDSDETLKIEDDFDWDILNDTSVESWNITSRGAGFSAIRTWMWNPKLDWGFYPDDAHERIYIEGRGESFQRVSLPTSFRHELSNDGVTWQNPNKFLSDALKLEEKVVAGNSLLENSYHFFYIGKSYNDCYGNEQLPLGRHLQMEYARRCIFYLEQFINFLYNGEENEMVYYSSFLVGDAYKFCGEFDKAIESYQKCEKFCSRRNEHLCGLAHLYSLTGEHEKMLNCTNILMSEERKNPFPDLCFLVHSSCYNDTGGHVKYLHEYACEHIAKS